MRRWHSSRCTSSMCCMLFEGTTTATSTSSFSFPPPIPVRPTVARPRVRAEPDRFENVRRVPAPGDPDGHVPRVAQRAYLLGEDASVLGIVRPRRDRLHVVDEGYAAEPVTVPGSSPCRCRRRSGRRSRRCRRCRRRRSSGPRSGPSGGAARCGASPRAGTRRRERSWCPRGTCGRTVRGPRARSSPYEEDPRTLRRDADGKSLHRREGGRYLMATFRRVEQEKESPSSGARDLPSVSAGQLGPVVESVDLRVRDPLGELALQRPSLVHERPQGRPVPVDDRLPGPPASSRIRTRASAFRAVLSLWLFRIPSARRVTPV